MRCPVNGVRWSLARDTKGIGCCVLPLELLCYRYEEDNGYYGDIAAFSFLTNLEEL